MEKVNKPGRSKPRRHVGLEKIHRGLALFELEVVPEKKDFYAALADGQKPVALWIGCSDSRVDPNLMTQSWPGMLFISRNVGAMVPPHQQEAPSGEGAAIEYAVKVLKVPHIIIAGHTHCGAMTAVSQAQNLDELPATAHWLRFSPQPEEIAAALRSDDSTAALPPKARHLDATIRANVVRQLEHLRTHPSVQAAVASGDLHLHGWVISIDTGQAREYDPELGRFAPFDPHGLHARA